MDIDPVEYKERQKEADILRQVAFLGVVSHNFLN